MVSADKAKEMICPQMLVDASSSRLNCLGKSCMAWRWGAIKQSAREAHPEADEPESGLGYCGLAGPTEIAVLDDGHFIGAEPL